jgi:hypothetical protein
LLGHEEHGWYKAGSRKKPVKHTQSDRSVAPVMLVLLRAGQAVHDEDPRPLA